VKDGEQELEEVLSAQLDNLAIYNEEEFSSGKVECIE